MNKNIIHLNLCYKNTGILLPIDKINENRAGIYALVNTINQHKYIGQTKNFKKRKKTHFDLLRKQKHNNPYLQNAWNLYGGSFIFCVIEFIPDMAFMNEMEKYWIDYFHSEYNIIRDPTKNCYDVMQVHNAEHDCLVKYEDEKFFRPLWHTWVYGSRKNPSLQK